MARRTARIEITDAPQSRMVPVTLGSLRVNVPVGTPTEVPEALLPVLDHARIGYRVIAPAEGGTQEDALQEAVSEGYGASGVDLSILDQSVDDLTQELAQVSDEGLYELLMAEHAGKTRKSATAAIEAEMDRRKE